MFCFATPWFLTLFVYNLPAESAARLWDVLFLLGVDRSQQAALTHDDDDADALSDAVLVERPPPAIDAKDAGSPFGLSIAEAASRRAKRKANAGSPPRVTFARPPLHDAFLQRFSLAVLRHFSPQLLSCDFHACVRLLHQLQLTPEQVTTLCEQALDVLLVARSNAPSPVPGAPRIAVASASKLAGFLPSSLPKQASAGNLNTVVSSTPLASAPAPPSDSQAAAAAMSMAQSRNEEPAGELPGVVWHLVDSPN